MRFRFCGDADCPDWVLAEITTLSRLSSVKLKLLGHVVAHSISQPPLDIEKAEKLLSESKLDPDVDLKTCIACLTFILTSATKFTCDQGVLSSELQQLGLPREHSQSIRKVYVDHSDTLAATLRTKSLRVNKLDGVTAVADSNVNMVTLDLNIGGSIKQVRMPQSLVRNMLEDLRGVRENMQELVASDHAL